MKKRMIIDGMSCGHCTARVKKTLEEITGISDVVVDLDSKTAEFESTDDIKDSDLKYAVEEAGYDVINVEILV
ncbi:MAG: heavy-metal-associated domain-containing protein [Solirubrobacterales bacterium]